MALKATDILTKLRQGEFLLALGVIGILALLFVPLPSFLLDLFFTVSIASAFLVLINVLFIRKATDFSSFPTILLITTLLRLSLNVASTRLILTDGHNSAAAAGHIIETFGNMVMGGSFVIGVVIFFIYVIFNFVVITKGATRIAEVAARFTLDSMPGKQMAIDADLNAGLINEIQAKARRTELENEIGFYGAMDGASKFVRGDAIAGLIITFVNIIAGLSVGVLMHDMPFAEAATRYTLLTVGDGLVAMVPALITSVAAGFLVSKSSAEGSTGTQVFREFSSYPMAMFASAGLLFTLSLIPGMPVLPFWLLAGALAGMGYLTVEGSKIAAQQAEIEEAKKAEQAPATPTEEPIASILHIDVLRLELGDAPVQGLRALANALDATAAAR